MLQTLLERAPNIKQLKEQEMCVVVDKSILVIEDDDGIREIVGDVLTEETIHQVFLAQDGKSGMNMLETVRPDLLLVDYRLPDITGLELIDSIRRIKGYEQTPVVLMSASLSRENVAGRCLRYLRKPFDLDRLLQIVQEALEI